MTYNNLPPQAYTKDDIARAFAWIQGQPEHVQNMATNKETLVALYLQSRRNGNVSLEKAAPVSSKDFQNQLKNLATELTQFESEKKEEPKATVPVSTKIFRPTSTPTVAPTPVAAPIAPAMPPEVLPTSTNEALQKTFEEFKTRPQSFDNPLPNSSKKTFNFQIDPRSEQIIRSVKAQLNMESEHDIIRMLLVLGFDRIKSLFPGQK